MIAYDAVDHKATLYPAELLQPATAYTVHIEKSVTDTRGNAMERAVVAHFITGPLDCAHLRDRFEPNDNIASATPIELDTLYPCLTSCGGTERTDYYRFTLTETKKIEVSTISAYVDTESVYWKIFFERQDGQAYCTLGTSWFYIISR